MAGVAPSAACWVSALAGTALRQSDSVTERQLGTGALCMVCLLHDVVMYCGVYRSTESAFVCYNEQSKPGDRTSTTQCTEGWHSTE